mgnify:CR=1 FL=1
MWHNHAATTLTTVSADGNVLASYRASGEAAATIAHDTPHTHHELQSGAAFFDVDNTIMRGSSLYHLAVGLAKRKYFTPTEIANFARKQLKFVLSGSEDMEDMASVTESALSFIEGKTVVELTHLGEEIFDEIMVDKLIPGTLALAQGHLDAGQQVWLVTATPMEVAQLIARKLGFTGGIGTVAEVRGGVYTGRLETKPMHGLAKAEAIKKLAQVEGLDLADCSAYSDSANDIPMLSAVGNAVAVNPDSELRDHAKANDWVIKDFRRRAQVKQYAFPAAAAAGGVALGLAIGYASGRITRRR